MNDQRWYAAGIRFSCAGCGACCTTHDDCAYVYLAEPDVSRIAARLGIEPPELLDRYCRSDADGTWLKMPGPRCIFLDGNNHCEIHSVRPRQCESWPFWSENLGSPRTWRESVVDLCPGVGRGRLYSADEIERIARARDEWYGIDFHS
ncbi:MAG: YkgJ family cysteine cluster protein [Polyangia bacterium]